MTSSLTPPNPEFDFVTAKVVAERLGMSASAVYAATRAGVLPAFRLGPRRLRYRLDEVMAALRRDVPKGKFLAASGSASTADRG